MQNDILACVLRCDIDLLAEPYYAVNIILFADIGPYSGQSRVIPLCGVVIGAAPFLFFAHVIGEFVGESFKFISLLLIEFFGSVAHFRIRFLLGGHNRDHFIVVKDEPVVQIFIAV